MQRTALITAALGIAMSTAGCVYTTRTITTERPVAVEDATTAWGKPTGWNITARFDAVAASLVVTPALLRECTRTRSQIYDLVESETTQLSGMSGGGNPLGLLLMAPLAVVFLPVTMLSKGMAEQAAANAGESTTRKARTLGTFHDVCAQPAADQPLTLALPSGNVLAKRSGADGVAHFSIPETEPDAGRAVVHFAGHAKLVAYYRTPQACADARADAYASALAVGASAARHELLGELPVACGDERDRSWQLVATAAQLAGDHRCANVLEIADVLRQLDHEMYADSFVREPDIALCLSPAHRGHAACVAQRLGALREAEEIGDVGARSLALARLPKCN